MAKALGAPLIEWHVKSTTKALQGLYEYDAVSRLHDSQLGDGRAPPPECEVICAARRHAADHLAIDLDRKITPTSWYGMT